MSLLLSSSAWTSLLYIEFEFHRVSNCRVRVCIKLDFCSSISSFGLSNTSFLGFFELEYKIIQKSRKEEVTFLFPVWDRWNHNKYLVQMTNPVIASSYNNSWWPSGKDTWLSHRQSGFKSRWDLFEEKFFLCLCFTKNLIPKSRNLYLSTPMDDFSKHFFTPFEQKMTKNNLCCLFYDVFFFNHCKECVLAYFGAVSRGKGVDMVFHRTWCIF